LIVEQLELVDFRNYTEARFELTTGTTVVRGGNGEGKSSFAEALAFLATLSSFRGVPTEAMIARHADRAVVRARVRDVDDRVSTIDAQIARNGRHLVLVNKQRLPRARDVLGTMRVTVFSPDDLTLVKGGPAERRRLMDDTLVGLAVKYDAMRLDLDRILKQRNRLLKQTGGRLSDETAATLDVWDSRLVTVGEAFGTAREALIDRLSPFVAAAYIDLAGDTAVVMRYEPEWRRHGLESALAASRAADVRRGSSTVGPHRDEVDLFVNEMPARTHASQGEQRTLALALRLAAHRLVAERTGSTPVLVLDDVLSELDPSRAGALLDHLPDGPVVITTAGVLPDRAVADRVITIERGAIVPGAVDAG
jgi:DNA replication and repair protein RecF